MSDELRRAFDLVDVLPTSELSTLLDYIIGEIRFREIERRETTRGNHE